MSTLIPVLIAALTVFRGVNGYDIDEISQLHNETQSVALQVGHQSRSGQPNTAELITQLRCEDSLCDSLEKHLNQVVPQLVNRVSTAVKEYKPEEAEGKKFKTMLKPWLSDIVVSCSYDSTFKCLADKFTIEGRTYLPYLSHPDILIQYANVIKGGKDDGLLRLFALLPWCLGNTYQIDCGIPDRAHMVWRVDAMCYNARGRFSTCNKYMPVAPNE